jgi:hypothetical protein
MRLIRLDIGKLSSGSKRAGQNTSPAVQAVYLQAVAFALPLGKAVASRSMQDGVPMRDLVADWEEMEPSEARTCNDVTLPIVTLLLGLLMTG